MINWKIDPNTDKQIRKFILALAETIYNNEETIKSLPDFEKVNDLGVIEINEIGSTRNLIVKYNGIDYNILIHLYNRENGNCLAVVIDNKPRPTLQLVLDRYIEKKNNFYRIWHDGIITGIANLTKKDFIIYIKEKQPNLIKTEDNVDFVELGVLQEKPSYSFSDIDFTKFISSLLLFSILRNQLKMETKSGTSNNTSNTPRYWIYAPGEKAIKWDEFYTENIMGLGWDELGDLTTFKTKGEIANKLKAIYGGDTSKSNDAAGNWEFVNELKYPLFYFDFETVAYPVPEFDESRPYQAVPFQYSLHVQRKKDAELEHLAFLGDGENDPREALIKELLGHLKSKGTILVWYKPFETTRLKELARDFPKYETKLNDLQDRIIDLMVPFKKQYYTHPGFEGSASIKNVLPVLVPDLSYGDLDVQDGMTASNMYGSLKNESPKIQKQHRKALLAYCHLDTLAMLKILKKLKETTMMVPQQRKPNYNTK